MSTFAMHVAKTGLNSQQIKMQVIANNLANVNTTGFKADRTNSSVAVSEFETEVSVLSRLNHGNIVRYLGSGYDPRRFIVLEYLEGGTLASVLGMCPGK